MIRNSICRYNFYTYKNTKMPVKSGFINVGIIFHGNQGYYIGCRSSIDKTRCRNPCTQESQPLVFTSTAEQTTTSYLHSVLYSVEFGKSKTCQKAPYGFKTDSFHSFSKSFTSYAIFSIIGHCFSNDI